MTSIGMHGLRERTARRLLGPPIDLDLMGGGAADVRRRAWLWGVLAAVFVTGCDRNQFVDRVLEKPWESSGPAAWVLPDVMVRALDGERLSLRSLMGERGTVVSFGSTWCIPCERELPVLQELYDRWSNEGLEVVVIMLDSRPAGIREWVEQYDLTFSIVEGSAIPEWARLHPDVEWALPMTLYIDGRGKVVRFVRGYRERATVEAAFRSLLTRGS